MNLIESIFRKRLLTKLKTILKKKNNNIINNLVRFWGDKLNVKFMTSKKKNFNLLNLFFVNKFNKFNYSNIKPKKFDNYENVVQRTPDTTTLL